MTKNKYIMKHHITKALLCLSMTLLVFNCQNEAITEQAEQTTAPQRTSKFSMLKSKEISSNKGLMRILENAEEKKLESSANKTVYNAEYDFTVNTNYAKVIQNENGLSNYTFGVSREEDNGLLENLLLKEQTDGTFLVYLVVYNITDTGRNALANQEIVDMENNINYVPLADISSSIFNKENSTAETCTVYSYEWEAGSLCSAGGNHSYQDGNACNGWNNPDQAATQGGWSLTSNEVNCGSGTSTGYDPGNPDTTNNNNTNTNTTNQNGGSSSSGYVPNPDTTPILCTDCPEIEEEEEDCPPVPSQLLNQLNGVLGDGNFSFDCEINAENGIVLNSIEELEELLGNNSFDISSGNTDGDNDPQNGTHSSDFRTGINFMNLDTSIVQILQNDTTNTNYNVENVNTSINGWTFGNSWTQTSTPNEFSIFQGISYVHVKGDLDYNLFFQGVGTYYTRKIRIEVRIDIYTGQIVGAEFLE